MSFAECALITRDFGVYVFGSFASFSYDVFDELTKYRWRSVPLARGVRGQLLGDQDGARGGVGGGGATRPWLLKGVGFKF